MGIPERIKSEQIKPAEIDRRKEQLNPEEFVVPLEEYEGMSPRLLCLQKAKETIEEFGGQIPSPFFVATHQAFEYYRGHGPTESLKKVLLDIFSQIREKNPDRGVFVGWRAMTPEGAPPGPRTAAIFKPEEFLSYVQRAWCWALEMRLDQPDSEIVLAFHPFIHASQEQKPEKCFLWPGGDGSKQADGSILVRAGFGPDELVQSCPVDTWIIRRTRSGLRLERNIVVKKTTVSSQKHDYPEIPVPKKFQKQPSLQDHQALQLAEIVGALNAEFDVPVRMEFILQQEGLIVREVAPHDPRPENFYFLKEPLQAPAVFIHSEDDIKKVTQPRSLVFLPRHLFLKRQVPSLSLELIHHALDQKIELTVLAWGEIASSHMMDNFKDARITVVFTQTKEPQEDQMVYIYQKEDGTPAWEIIGEKKKSLYALDEPEALNPEIVGEKAANLARMIEADIPVPPGFCLTTETIKDFLFSLGLAKQIHELDQLENEVLREALAEIRNKITQADLPEKIMEEVENQLQKLPDSVFSVRSSSPEEDIAAGQYKSFLEVSPEEVFEAIKKSLASLYSYGAVRQAQNEGIPPSRMEMAVLIHPLIKGRGGVVDAGPKEIIITAAEKPELVTAGATEKAHIITFNQNAKVTADNQEKIIKIKEARNLANLIKKAMKKISQKYQRFEWVIDEKGNIWILQSRPL